MTTRKVRTRAGRLGVSMSRLVQQPSADGGNALLIAVMVTAVCLSLSLIGVQLAVASSRSSGVDRQRVLAVNAAEAGVDGGYTAIQAAGVNLPCTLASGNVRSAPDTASYSTAVTYYNAAGAALACPLLAGAVPAQALIRSTATTNTLGGRGSKPTRVMEALVNLTPQSSTGLDKAIFANGVLDTSQGVTVLGNAGANADVYSNNNVICGMGMSVAGSVDSQGDISTNQGCTVAGNLWAKGTVTTGPGNSVAGFVKAGTGTITAGLGTVVTGNLYAGGTITYSGCLAGQCFPNSSPGPPPALAFPIIRSDAATMAAWTAPSPGPGYTLYDDNNCGTVEARIRNTYAKKGTPTLLRTTCAVNHAFGASVVLNNDLAIFATGGFSAGMGTAYSSNLSGTKRNLHWIVPYGAGTPPCSSPTISTGMGMSVTSDIWMFMYSPCDMSFGMGGAPKGQIYGGSKITSNQGFTLQFQRVPTYGIDPTSLPATSYTPSVVYKRESR